AQSAPESGGVIVSDAGRPHHLANAARGATGIGKGIECPEGRVESGSADGGRKGVDSTGGTLVSQSQPLATPQICNDCSLLQLNAGAIASHEKAAVDAHTAGEGPSAKLRVMTFAIPCLFDAHGVVQVGDTQAMRRRRIERITR